MRSHHLLIIALLAGAALLVSGCTSPPPSLVSPTPAPTTAPTTAPTSAATESKAKIVKLDADPCKSWDPCEIRIKAGATVVWSNDDVLAHDVTFVDGPEKPKSGAPGTLEPGKTWSYKFEKPGTYEFHCAIHHPLMHTPGSKPKLVVE